MQRTPQTSAVASDTATRATFVLPTGCMARLSGMNATVEVLLLGPIEARRGGETIALAGSKLQALVALLALAAPHSVSDDRLIDELWGDASLANPANALQAQVSQLRRVLGRDAVTRQP